MSSSRAVTLGEVVIAGRADLAALNARSLAMRGELRDMKNVHRG